MNRVMALFAVVLSVCSPATAGQAELAADCDLPESIGGATMLADGTIAFQLRAESEDGIVGESYFEIEPSDSEYEEYKAHIGGINPGEDKPVPPWLPEHCSVP